MPIESRGHLLFCVSEVRLRMVSPRCDRKDQGFTVVEVVVAAAILFFALTATLGLVAASQKMSLGAKQRTILTNATSYYIDRVRSMPFDSIGIQGVDTSGTIPANDSVSISGYVVNVSNAVASYKDLRGDTYLKELILRATFILNGKTYTTNAVAAIKNPNNDRSSATIADPNSPVIQFDDNVTPPPNEVLFDDKRYTNWNPIKIQTSASSPHDQIVEVSYHCGSSALVFDPSTMQYAKFTFVPGAATASNSSGWDTKQPGIGEGFQTLTVLAKDSLDRTVTLDRRYIIDNLPPSAPGAPEVAVSTASTSVAQWAAAPDGNQAFAFRYAWTLFAERSGAAAPPSAGWSEVATGTLNSGSTVSAGVGNAGPIRFILSHEPFTRYWMRVKAGSPRLWNDTSYGEMPKSFITRPDVKMTAPYQSVAVTTATWSKVKQVTYGVTIWLPKPTFPYNNLALANKASYIVDRYDPATKTWASESSAYYSVDTTDPNCIKMNIMHIQPNTITPQKYYFRVGVTVTPTGWNDGTTATTVYAPAAGPMPQPLPPTSGTSSSASGPIAPDWSL
jgi:Tfp pilus assembly protein PilV